jgi:hypothetical protein
MRVAGILQVSYYELKGHSVVGQGDHLDRVHSDQKVLKLIRWGMLVW